MRAWAALFLALALGLGACQGRLSPELVQGDYVAQAGSPGKAVTWALNLQGDGQAVESFDDGSGKPKSRYGLWSLKADEVSITLFKDDPYVKAGSRQMAEATLLLKAKRSTRSLWLEKPPQVTGIQGPLEFKKR